MKIIYRSLEGFDSTAYCDDNEIAGVYRGSDKYSNEVVYVKYDYDTLTWVEVNP